MREVFLYHLSAEKRRTRNCYERDLPFSVIILLRAARLKRKRTRTVAKYFWSSEKYNVTILQNYLAINNGVISIHGHTVYIYNTTYFLFNFH